MSLSHALRGIERRRDDRLVAGAPAEVAGECLAHLCLVRVGMLAQELGERHEDPRCAETALQAVMVLERLLKPVELAVRGKRFDRDHFLPLALHREHQARPGTRAADQYRARAAHSMLAADVRAGEVQLVAQEIGERQARFDFARVRLAIERDGDAPGVRHE